MGRLSRKDPGSSPDRVRYTSVGRGRAVFVEQLRLIIVLFFTGACLLAVETTVAAKIPLPIPGTGVGLPAGSPSLGLLFCMAVGFLYGEQVGGVAGLLTGWLADATDCRRVMILPLLYFLCGYLSGVIGKRKLAHNLPSFLVFAALGGGLELLFSVLRETVELRGLPPLSWVMHTRLPVWILTFVFSPLVYGILRGEKRLMERK